MVSQYTPENPDGQIQPLEWHIPPLKQGFGVQFIIFIVTDVTGTIVGKAAWNFKKLN